MQYDNTNFYLLFNMKTNPKIEEKTIYHIIKYLVGWFLRYFMKLYQNNINFLIIYEIIFCSCT